MFFEILINLCLKIFRPPFSKGGAGRGRVALVARRNERNSFHAVFGSFCGNFAKKNGVSQINVSHEILCEKTVSVLFEQGAAKRTKNSER